MDGRMSMTGWLSSALVESQIPAWYNAEGEMYVAKKRQKVTDGNRTKMSWIRGSVLALWPFSTMGWPDVNSRRLKRCNVNLGNRFTISSSSGCLVWFFQSLEFTGRQPFKNVLIHGLIRDEQDARCRSHSVTGLTQWMSSRNTVRMPFVGSFQTVLHQGKTCVSLTRKWMLHGTSLTRFGTSLAISLWTMKGWPWMWRVKM